MAVSLVRRGLDSNGMNSSDESDIEDELHYPQMAEDSDDSDRELQIAFQSGLLKPGTYREKAPERIAVNNVHGMIEKLEEIDASKLEWTERLDVTVERKSREDESLSQGLSADEAQALANSRLFTVHNDFKRELMFLTQAKDAVLEALPQLKSYGIPTVRPDDYFAEMAKKDDHMKKVREKLLVLQRKKESAEKYRNQLKLKKYGKKVQKAVEAERRQKKKDILESVKKFRKGNKESVDFLDDEDKKGSRKPSQMQQSQKRKKSRSFRDKKFGYGGRKKGTKSNTDKSTNDVSSFRQRKPQSRKAQSGKPNNKRLGKGRRQKMKNRKR